MRNQYKILAEKYEQQIVKQDDTVSESPMKPGTPKVTPYIKSDGSTAYKSQDEWGHRGDWRTSAAAHKAAGIPEPKQAEPEKVMKEAPLKYADFSDDENFEYNGRYYSVEAIFDWENKATDHQASIGHPGVTGRDIYRDVPVRVNQLQVTDMETGNVVTDKEVLNAAAAFALTTAQENPDSYHQYEGTTAMEDTDPYGTKQVREIMEPMVHDRPDAEDRVAAGIRAKLDMTDRSHDSILEAIRAYWLELEAEWKQYNPTQPMPEDVREELWQSVYKGMLEANVDPTDVFG